KREKIKLTMIAVKKKIPIATLGERKAKTIFRLRFDFFPIYPKGINNKPSTKAIILNNTMHSINLKRSIKR
ncbi:MAG: hypothetical protein E7E95_09220, partial [Prevotella bivia]|nr:hypothetical protein [Prevotella bivia]